MPSSFSRIECVIEKVKNGIPAEIGRLSASVADSTNDAKRITCAAFGGDPPVIPQGQCE